MTRRNVGKTMVPIAERLVPRASILVLAKIDQPRLEAKPITDTTQTFWAYIYNRCVSVFGGGDCDAPLSRACGTCHTIYKFVHSKRTNGPMRIRKVPFDAVQWYEDSHVHYMTLRAIWHMPLVCGTCLDSFAFRVRTA